MIVPLSILFGPVLTNESSNTIKLKMDQIERINIMRKIFLTTAICCLLAGSGLADFNWNVESGVWSDGANWDKGYKPDGTENINLRFSDTSVCTLNTDEGLFTNRLIVQYGQTWNIENGGRAGFAWSRVGRGSLAIVNMSGNGAYVCNNDDLYIGLEAGGSCLWTMADTSSITVEPATTGGDNLYIAQDTSTGTLKLVGSQVTVHTNEVVIGYVKAVGSSPVATIEFVMDADGAGTIVSDDLTTIISGSPGANAAAHLVLSAPGITLAPADIVLIECLGASAIGGRGGFDTMNGGSAAEGTPIILGGNLYTLTYAYAANGVAQNDVALKFVRSGKHMATAPVPADGSTVNSIPSALSWTNPDPNDGVSEITCTVYFGMDPNRPQMDSLTLGANVYTVDITAANFPTYGVQPLPDNSTFYWVVDCADPSADPADGKGMYWSFTTDLNDAPVVNAGSDQVAWMGKSGTPGQEVISLTGSVSDDGLPNPPGAYTVLWTQVSGPDTVTFSPDNAPSTSVTITVAGIYEFMLTADDSEKQTSDTVEIIVGTDSCQASFLSGSNYNSKDFDQDCDVDLVDFANFVEDWLMCTNILEPCN